MMTGIVRMKISRSVMRRGMTQGYRSGLEKSIGEQLASSNVTYAYECERIPYVTKGHTYTPDFKIGNVYIETKGYFLPKDRTKHLLLREQYPDMDLRFVFTNPQQKLYKGAKTTYADWCTKHGFSFSKRSIPESWIREFMHKA